MNKEFKVKNRPFLDSMNYIDDKILAEVLAEVKVPNTPADDVKPRRAWRQIAVFAACMVLLGALIPTVTWMVGRISSGITPGGNPVEDASASRVIKCGNQVYGSKAFTQYYASLNYYAHEDGIFERLNNYDENDANSSYRAIEVLSQIVDGKLYYIYDSLPTIYSDLKAAYLDISTMTSTEIGDISVSSITDYAFVYDNYYYYSNGNILTHKGAIYRMSLEDGTEELILEFDNEESLLMVADGVIVTMNRFAGRLTSSTPENCIITAYDIETLEKRELWSNDEGDPNYVYSPAYLDGYLYFLTEIREQGTPYLMRINLASGEAECVIERTSSFYWITDNGIWYYPLEWRTVNYHPMWSSILNDLFSTNASATLHYCDLDGGNDLEVYTNADFAIESYESAVIIDGKLCARVCGDFPSLGLKDALFFAEVDLATGVITKLKD